MFPIFIEPLASYHPLRSAAVISSNLYSTLQIRLTVRVCGFFSSKKDLSLLSYVVVVNGIRYAVLSEGRTAAAINFHFNRCGVRKEFTSGVKLLAVAF